MLRGIGMGGVSASADPRIEDAARGSIDRGNIQVWKDTLKGREGGVRRYGR